MDLDTDVKTFTYDGQEFRVQLWKGTYGGGGAVGSEFAIYSRSEAEALAQPYTWESPDSKYILFEAVDQQYQPKVCQMTTYESMDGTEKSFDCDTRRYGDSDDYWNLSIRTEAGVDKDSVSVKYAIDCEAQGTGYAEAMEAAFENDPLIKDVYRKGDIVYIEY